MTRPHRFAIASFQELWWVDHRALLERRLVHGALEDDGARIDAHDAADEELLARARAQLGRAGDSVWRWASARGSVPRRADARVHAEARRTGEIVESATIILTINGVSVVTTPESISSDGEWLDDLAARRPHESIDDYRGVPLLWKRGCASVLLHEAAGHAAEHGHRRAGWPEWLTVRDEPSTVDDTGERRGSADLLAGEAPHALRRETFVHPVLPRMSHVVAQQKRAPFALPDRHIAIHLLAGGHYEPLTEMVSVFVAAADLVQGRKATPLQPFTIREARARVASALAGAGGDAVRYPGVICSREGQELVVGSAAPEMVTVF